MKYMSITFKDKVKVVFETLSMMVREMKLYKRLSKYIFFQIMCRNGLIALFQQLF